MQSINVLQHICKYVDSSYIYIVERLESASPEQEGPIVLELVYIMFMCYSLGIQPELFDERFTNLYNYIHNHKHIDSYIIKNHSLYASIDKIYSYIGSIKKSRCFSYTRASISYVDSIMVRVLYNFIHSVYDTPKKIKGFISGHRSGLLPEICIFEKSFLSSSYLSVMIPIKVKNLVTNKVYLYDETQGNNITNIGSCKNSVRTDPPFPERTREEQIVFSNKERLIQKEIGEPPRMSEINTLGKRKSRKQGYVKRRSCKKIT